MPTLRRRCDALIQIIGKRKNPKSLISGLSTQVMHHFFPKSVSSFHRYNWGNLIPLTNGEHLRLHSSGDPSIQQKIIEIKGQKWYDGLNRTKRNYIKAGRQYYEEMYKKLKSEE